ncbi:STAS/SEC14 domain-containing protein [candidate division WOR-3 bacterium]|nr:STAS/SEC14 domain-containing protein [candidate division WOR-3 bacterium]
MDHRLYLDEEQDVFHIHIVGDITPEGYIAINRTYNTWEGGKPKKVIIDLTETNMSTMVPWDRETRQRVTKSTEPFTSDTKVAVIGVTGISRMVMKIAFNVLGVVKTGRFFKTEAEALAWLKEETKR